MKLKKDHFKAQLWSNLYITHKFYYCVDLLQFKWMSDSNEQLQSIYTAIFFCVLVNSNVT